jgi:hypothetical protein
LLFPHEALSLDEKMPAAGGHPFTGLATLRGVSSLADFRDKHNHAAPHNPLPAVPNNFSVSIVLPAVLRYLRIFMSLEFIKYLLKRILPELFPAGKLQRNIKL